MNNPLNRISDPFNTPSDSESQLLQYLQNLEPETVARLSKPDSKDVFQIMEQNIVGLLGHLPSESFNISVTVSREQLGKLLASAMMSGYFLRNAEQRFNFERSLQQLGVASTELDEDAESPESSLTDN